MRRNDSSSVIARLHRLEGQLRGIERLIDQGQPLPLILQQLSAAGAATRAVMVTLLETRLTEDEDGTITLTAEEARWIKKLLRQ